MSADPFLLPGAPATLVLDEEPYAGGEIEVRLDVPYGVLKRIRAWMREYRDTPVGSDEEEAALRSAWELFADEALISWNLADHRGPIPSDGTAFDRLPVRLLMEIVGTWAGSIGRVAPPLPSGSPSTEPEPATPTLTS